MFLLYIHGQVCHKMLNAVKSSSFCKNSLTTRLLQGKKVNYFFHFYTFIYTYSDFCKRRDWRL